MANFAGTAGTIGPLVPWSGSGNSRTSVDTIPIPVSAATVYQVGDVIILGADGLADVDNDDPADGAVIGICVEDKAAITSPTPQDTIAVAPAFPGSLFEGSLVASIAGGDVTGVLATHIGVSYDLDQDDVTGYAVIDVSDVTNPAVTVLAFSPTQRRGVDFIDNDSPVNPRVIVSFLAAKTALDED